MLTSKQQAADVSPVAISHCLGWESEPRGGVPLGVGLNPVVHQPQAPWSQGRPLSPQGPARKTHTHSQQCPQG